MHAWLYVFVKLTYIEHYCQYTHDLRVFVFGAFLKPPLQLQTTRSPRLLNGFWRFFMQSEEEVLLVSFLFSTVHFCWVENEENFERSKKTVFPQAFLCHSEVLRPAAHQSWALMGKMSPKSRKYAILSLSSVSRHNKQLNKQSLWVSAWSEQ